MNELKLAIEDALKEIEKYTLFEINKCQIENRVVDGLGLEKMKAGGNIVDYDVNYNDITKEVLISYWVKPPSYIMVEFKIDDQGNIEIFQEGEEDACEG